MTRDHLKFQPDPKGQTVPKAKIGQMDVDEQACAWLIRLRDDDVSVEQISKWQNWMAKSLVHQDSFEKVSNVWAMVDELDVSGLEPTMAEIAADPYRADRSITSFLADKPHAKTTSTRRKIYPKALWAHFTENFRRPAFITITASLMVIASLLGWQMTGGYGDTIQDRSTANNTASPKITASLGQGVHPEFDSPTANKAKDVSGKVVASIMTETAEHRTAKLFDGSQVDVGAKSKVSVDFSKKIRRVKLEAGEAYFVVSPDSSRPFIVSTPLGNVTAVGTAFNVRLAGDRIVVSVSEGKVDVRPPHAIQPQARSPKHSTSKQTMSSELVVRVEAGSEVIMVQVQDRMQAQPIKQASGLDWQAQRRIYRAEPLQYVIADMNRYIDQKIILDDPVIGAMPFSGVVMPKNAKIWIEALPYSFAVEVLVGTNGEIRIVPRQKN